MPQKKHKPEEIVAKLRQIDVLLSQGRSVGEAVRTIGVTQFTYYRWRKVEGRTHNGRKFRMLNIIDEFTRECLAIRIDRKLNSTDVIDALSDLFILRGVPGHARSDNGPEFIAKVVREWIAAVGAKTAFIEPGSPWENGYCESFNSKLRDELLNGEIFYSLAEARVIIEAWRRYYNSERPHSSLGYKPPAPEAIVWPAPRRRSAPLSAQAMAGKPIMH
jgi:transposase InsO family protein